MDLTGLIAVLLAGLLAGSELTSWAIVHPTLWKLDHHAQVRAEKLMYKRFASIDPFLMTATVVACFVGAAVLEGTSSTLALAAALCFSAMLAITLIGNMPLNPRVFRWDEEGGDPRTSGGVSRAGGTGCRFRIALDVAGFVLVALAVVGP